MVKLHDINESAVFAWSDSAIPLIATGTLAGVIDDTFSSDSNLSIYSPFENNNNNNNNDNKTLSPIYKASAPSKFSSIEWNNEIIAAGLENSTIQLFNSSKLLNEKPSDLINSRISEYKKHSSPVLQVKFNPLQSNILGSSASKGEIFIWDLNKNISFNPGQAISPMSKISSLSWNNNKSHIFGTAGDSGFASIWDLKVKREVLQLNYSNINLSVLKWHPNQSTKLITASDNDNEPIILTWDLRNSSTPEKILKGHKKGILSLDWCLNDPNLLLSSGKDDSTYLWNPINGNHLATYPSLPNWIHETKFAPKIPEIFACASLSKNLLIQSLQDTSEPLLNKTQNKDENDFWNEISTTETQKPLIKINQSPIWLKRPISANFGYGGKLSISNNKIVKIVNISIKDESIDNSAKNMINAISTNNFNDLCNLKLNDSSLNKIKNSFNDWSLLKKILQKSSIESILNLKKDEEKVSDNNKNFQNDDSKSIFSDDLLDDNDDDDFFQQIGNSNLNKEELKFNKFIPQGNFNLNPESFDNNNDNDIDVDVEFEKKAVCLLLSKKDDELLDLCIENNHIMEALIISMNGSDELKDKAKSAFFSKFSSSSSFARLLYSTSNNSISDIVKNGNIESWMQIAESIINFSKDKSSFKVEMKLLGDRLLNSKIEDSRDHALSCYIIADSLDKVSNIWLSELKNYEDYYLLNSNEDGSKNTTFEARFKALGEIIEKIVVFFQSTSTNSLSEDLHDLGKIFVEYADSLVNFGHYELAYKLLNMISDSIPEIKIEKDRISKAFLTNINSNINKNIDRRQSTTSKYSTSIPLQQNIAINQQPSLTSSIPTTKTRKNPYVFSNTSSNRDLSENKYQTPSIINQQIPPSTNPYTSKSSINPYQPITSSTLASNTFNNNTNGSYQQINGTSNNPYAPKTALDSLKNPISNSMPPPLKKENVPPSFKKDVGGWNDLPSHLEPVIKPASISTLPPNPFVNHQRTSSSARNVSQALPIPPPPTSVKDGTGYLSPSLPALPLSRVPSIKNPYAPKPEVFQLPTVVTAKSPLIRTNEDQQFSQQQAPSPKILKNPYAPKTPSVNPYAPSSIPSQPPQQQQFYSQSIQTPPSQFQPLNNQFNAAPVSVSAPVPPPPPSYTKPVTQPPKVSGVLPPKTVSTPPPQSVSTPPTQSISTSSVQTSYEPIINILTKELEIVKPKIPEKFTKHVLDAEKRINILFAHLKNGDLLSDDVVNKLSHLATALDDSDFTKAKAIRDEISTGYPNECGDWMIGIKRLIALVEANSK
jgi:protein transport protein SEC31